MKKIDIEQGSDEWLDYRIGLITGTKADGIALEHYANRYDEYTTEMNHLQDKLDAETDEKKRDRISDRLSRMQDKTAAELPKYRKMKIMDGFWNWLAEKWVDPALCADETPIARGHRLEPVNIQRTAEMLDIYADELDDDPGMWQSLIHPELAVSPDACEKAKTPTWAIECKSLGTANHLKYAVTAATLGTEDSIVMHGDINGLPDVFRDIALSLHGRLEAVQGIDLIPPQYVGQVLQYFIVNDDLTRLYFSLYDDRLCDKMQYLRHVVITIYRKDIEQIINSRLLMLEDSIKLADDIERLYEVAE